MEVFRDFREGFFFFIGWVFFGRYIKGGIEVFSLEKRGGDYVVERGSRK